MNHLFLLERMAERGIAWSNWRAKIANPWDFHRRIRGSRARGKKRKIQRRGFQWWTGTFTSSWLAIRNVGKPLILTTLVFLYRILSNFGRSIVLPALWLMLSLIAFGFWYGSYATSGLSPDKFKLVVVFTLSNAMSFVGASKKPTQIRQRFCSQQFQRSYIPSPIFMAW